MLTKITESGMDRLMDGFDRWSRVMAWAAVLAAMCFIVAPALWSIWGR